MYFFMKSVCNNDNSALFSATNYKIYKKISVHGLLGIIQIGQLLERYHVRFLCPFFVTV